jgi:hypothetical protein
VLIGQLEHQLDHSHPMQTLRAVRANCMDFECPAAVMRLKPPSNEGKMTFAGFMFGRTPSAALARMAVSNFQTDDPRAALEAEFTELLAGYLAEHRSLTARDCHCLANAMRLMCLGLYDQAFEQITQIRCPPADFVRAVK